MIFPVFTVTHLTMRKDPIYHSTYTCRPPEEPAVLGEALNQQVFIPIFAKAVSGKLSISIFLRRMLLPSCSCYNKNNSIATLRVMSGSMVILRQFMYTKFVIVCMTI